YSRDITTFDDPAIAELNPDMELPGDEIVPVHRSDSSGTTFVFSHYLSTEVESWADEYGEGKELNWADGLVGGQQNDGVAQGITQNPGGLGYVNQSFAQEAGLSVASIVNEDGEAIEPTLESTIAASEEAEIPEDFQFTIDDIGGQGYPIAGTNWIFTHTCGYEQDSADAIIDFWTWALTDESAREMTGELCYAPLGEELTDRVVAEIEKTNAENGGGDSDTEGDADAGEQHVPSRGRRATPVPPHHHPSGAVRSPTPRKPQRRSTCPPRSVMPLRPPGTGTPGKGHYGPAEGASSIRSSSGSSPP